MFSQWRSKRHFPMDSGPSAYPTSSQPTVPGDLDFPQRDAFRPLQHTQSLSLSAGVKGLGRVGIGKGAKFRPGTRDGSTGARSPMSFAAGPRSTSRGANSLEFGGGVVPDDSHSEAERSESSASPNSPQDITSTVNHPGIVSIGRSVDSTAPSKAHASGHGRDDSHSRLESIGTLGSFEDFRSLIAFSSPHHLLDESPALTTSTNLSSPDVAAASVAVSTDKPLPVSLAEKPQPPIPTSSEPAMAASADSKANSGLPSARVPPKTLSVKMGPSSADETVHLRPELGGVQRRSTASSLPESVSQPGSSQLASEEFHSSVRRISTTDAMRKLEESIREGSSRAATFGLGIIAPEDADSADASSRANFPTLRNSLSARHHTKSNSELSDQSSADSWGRTSFGRDTLRMLIDAEQHDEMQKTASHASSKIQRAHVSDSGHSTNTAETSADVHDSDQLSTIKERTESPESVLKRRVSMDSGFSQSQVADLSDTKTSRTSASSTASDAFRISVGRAEGQEGSDKEHKSSLPVQLRAGFTGIGSPTFGFRQRKISQSSTTASELLPAFELGSGEFQVHARTTSNASSTYSRKAPAELSAGTGLRRGSAGVSSSASSRLAPEPYTTPLPSLPFPMSSSAPLLQAKFPRAAPQSSEPNTPNLAYEAALAKAVGKQRKGRPAALALNLTSLSAFSPNGPSGAILSPNTLSFRGLASPGKPRAPPPSAPPTEPLPPIPNTPSLAPKSPNPLQWGVSGNATAPASGTAARSNELDPLRTPKGSRSPPMDTEKSLQQERRGSQPKNDPLSASSGPSVPVSQHIAAAEQRNALISETRKQPEAVTPIGIRDASTSEPTLTSDMAASEDSSDSPTVVSMDDYPDSAATVTVVRTATRISSHPVRLSMGKKDPKEESKQVETKVDSSISTPPSSVDAKAQTSADQVDQNATSTSPAKLRQTVAFELESQKEGSEPPSSCGRRLDNANKPPRPPPSAWSSRKTASVAQADAALASPVTSGTAPESGQPSRLPEELRDGAASVASCHSTFSTLSDRRHEILSDKAALLGSHLTESVRQDLLKRTEGRFAGAFNEVAHAFRQLQADKLLLEQIVREKTPLSGVGANNEMLSDYLSTMNAKVEHSNSEIRKLLDLLEQQREVIEQMLATHQLEKETYVEEVERLRCALDETQAEAEHHRAAVVRLNGELTKAHKLQVQASAEAMKVKGMLVEEERKREKAVGLLREAKERLREVEKEKLAALERVDRSEETDAAEAAEDVEHLNSCSAESEVAMLRQLLEERDSEIASLRLSHADAVMQHSTTTAAADDDDADSGNDANVSLSSPPSPSADEITRLRTQIAEQKDREKQIRTAYMYVRDELRKANSERRRPSTASISGLTTPTSSPYTALGSLTQRNRFTGAPDHARTSTPAGRLGFALDPDHDRPGTTPLKLKRLSLPIVAKASSIAAVSTSPDQTQHSPHQVEQSYTNSAPSAFRSGSSEAVCPLPAHVEGEQQPKPNHARRHSRQLVQGPLSRLHRSASPAATG